MAYLEIDKTKLINLEYALTREIIRTNQSGAYACTTIIDCNTRKYHGLLICALPEVDGGRHVLLSGLDETIIQHDAAFNLGLHKYAGDNYEPKGHKYIRDFSSSPIPRLEYRVGGVVLSKEKILVQNENQILIKYTLLEAKSPTRIRFKPFLAFRNIHMLSKANLNVNTKFYQVENGIASCLYEPYPKLYMQFNKNVEFTPAPDWYYNIEYKEDQDRGYDYKEDLYVPGFFEMPIKKGESIIFSASINEAKCQMLPRKFNTEIKKRIPRENFSTCLANTIQQFYVFNKNKLDIMAGFPWLPIRTRDALIALPGLTLPFDDKKNFGLGLKTIASRFENHLISDIPEQLNSKHPIDIPLWFVWSVQQYSLRYGSKLAWKQFGGTIQNIITGFLNETKLFELKHNGLLYLNDQGYPHTWMNAHYENKVLVNRRGYLVEVNALWYNALNYFIEFKSNCSNKNLVTYIENTIYKLNQWFEKVFWNESKGYLNDFVTDEHINDQLRPNQIFAASLPYVAIKKGQIISLLDKMRSELLTAYGLRSLSPNEDNYMPVYEGDHLKREVAAFNGSVWPWLLTPYFEAYLKVQTASAVREANEYFKTFEEELKTDGICSISELYHGNPPHKAKGAISYAKNTGELIRLKYIIDKTN